MRHQYSVELDIWHAGVHPQQLKSSRRNYWRPEDGVADVWIVIAWVDISWAAAGCFGGESSSFLLLFSCQTTNASCVCFPIQILKDATLFFSWDMPNLAMVIPAMDHIDEILSLQSLDRQYDVSIRASLGLAKKLSIVTTVWQICLRCTGLQWVCI